MKTIVYIGTSLDGVIARTNGDTDWLTRFASEEALTAYNEGWHQTRVRKSITAGFW